MKKIYLLSALTLSVASYAQTAAKKARTLKETQISVQKLGQGSAVMNTVDTLMPPQFAAACFTGDATPFTLYSLDNVAPKDSGYVSGLNAYGDIEKAQKYTVTGNASVTSVLVFAKASGGAAITSVKLYDVNATTKGPGTTTLGTSSNTIAFSAMPAVGTNTYTFSTPVAVNNTSFFASVILPASPAASDTFGIITNKGTCVGTDSLSWEKWNDNTWHAFSNPGNWDLNVDMCIFPVVDIPAGINSVSKNQLSLFAASPNPASNEIAINYSLSASSKVEINIYDATGRLVKNIKTDELNSGKHNTKIDVSNFDSGVYMYGVKTGNANLFSKFIIAK